MTQAERHDTLKSLEKDPLQSKKFVTWLINQLLLAALAALALLTQKNLGWSLATFMVLIVFTMGISTMWAIGKQAACDIAVRGYAIVGDGVAKLKGSKATAPAAEEESES